MRIPLSLFKCNYPKIENLCLSFLFHLCNLHQILNIFKSKKILIANVFPKLHTVKDLLRLLSKKLKSTKSILFRIVRIYLSLFKCNFVKNKNLFRIFLFHLCDLHQVLKLFKAKTIVIANAFRKFQTVKDLVRPLSKKRHCRTSFDSQHVNGSQTLAKSAWKQFYQIFQLLSRETIWKISPLLKFELIGVFVKTLTSNYK